MYTTKFWHCQYIQSTKIILFFVFLLFNASSAFAQEDGFNMMDHDQRKFYFGITAGLNNSQFRIYNSDYFLKYDTVLSATPKWNAGFQVGIMGTLKLTNHTALRFVPQFVLTQKTIAYTFKTLRDTTIVIESILTHLPLSLKFASDRIGNFKFYTIAGLKLDYDFNSNTRSRRNDDVLKIKAVDYGYDLGLGFEFYYPNYIFTPEIKISNGFNNVQLKDNDILTSKVFDKINSRMIYIGFTIGG
jgi:Outer membrane protein beta-barrel domain